ncbi:unnamed protein product [Spirodela intermedia]|uniref:Uncharacterized protein n=1 Tax=Spirodela intermedia TaxID=51605 RepID=A0A7I8J0Y9_SPIIN|nr:unnamed protein product [Spirodela intermedia]CAA6663071.1 unnamed protein product [Spirodela intermedia]CAA6674151.1 unnamed protein product [Spirodela intermedia]CAA6674836.1 unnamed protein product [Spirodela intermedia]
MRMSLTQAILKSYIGGICYTCCHEPILGDCCRLCCSWIDGYCYQCCA